MTYLPPTSSGMPWDCPRVSSAFHVPMWQEGHMGTSLQRSCCTLTEPSYRMPDRHPGARIQDIRPVDTDHRSSKCAISMCDCLTSSGAYRINGNSHSATCNVDAVTRDAGSVAPNKGVVSRGSGRDGRRNGKRDGRRIGRSDSGSSAANAGALTTGWRNLPLRGGRLYDRTLGLPGRAWGQKAVIILIHDDVLVNRDRGRCACRGWVRSGGGRGYPCGLSSCSECRGFRKVVCYSTGL
jgi:hypothetical protein